MNALKRICLLLTLSIITLTASAAFGDYVEVSAGYDHFMVLKKDGTLWSWGSNEDGQLGDGTTTDRDRSRPIKILDNVKYVSAGGCFTMAILNDGSLWGWGDNYWGQLGDGTITDRLRPVKILDGVRQVSVGKRHTMAILNDGSLWGWGWNSDGQLGDGTTTDRDRPVKILDGVRQVSSGFGHTMAILNDGSLWGWGWNSHGQLGDGTTTDCHRPVKILDGVRQVSVGRFFTMAILNDGSLWGWGSDTVWTDSDNHNGDAADHLTCRLCPGKILDGIRQVSSGEHYTMVILNDGSLWGWGRNSAWVGDDCGLLGDGTSVDRYSPVKLVTGVKKVAAGGVISIWLMEDGTLRTTGEWNEG